MSNFLSFKDVALAKNITVKRNQNTFERYVEGGHLDSDSLRVKRFGVFGDDYVGPAFNRIFRKGDILYGSRRTYLKKVAVPDFDGITANTTFVVNSKKNDQFIDGLLPHLMLTNKFTDFSIKNSKGSTNPYINWKDLEDFRFKCVDIDKQKYLYSILCNLEKILSKIDEKRCSLLKLKAAIEKELILGGNDFFTLFTSKEIVKSKGWKLYKLSDLLKNIQYGSSDPLYSEGKVPVLRMMNLENGCVSANDLKYSVFSEEELANLILNKGDILFNRTNSMEWVGRTALFNLEGTYAFASYLLRLDVNKEIATPEFVNRYLNLPLIQYRLKAYATPGVSQANINPSSLKQLPILLPSIDKMIEAENILKKYDELLAFLDEKEQAVNNLRAYFREMIFLEE